MPMMVLLMGTANNVDTLVDVEAIIEGRNNNPNLVNNAVLSNPNAADATFSANKMEFGFTTLGGSNSSISGDLGQNRAISASGTAINASNGTGSGNNAFYHIP